MAGYPLISARMAVDVLNEALTLDSRAISALVRHRVMFTSTELADHPTIQVGEVDDVWISDSLEELPVFDVGLVGILNGIFGTEDVRIAIVADDDFYINPNKMIEKFECYDDWPNQKPDPVPPETTGYVAETDG